MAQTLCDDLGRCLAAWLKRCTRSPSSMQPFAQCLKLADEPVDFPDRARRYALKQRTDIVRHDRAVIFRVPPQAGEVKAHKFADFPSTSASACSSAVVSRSKILMFESPFVAISETSWLFLSRCEQGNRSTRMGGRTAREAGVPADGDGRQRVGVPSVEGAVPVSALRRMTFRPPSERIRRNSTTPSTWS
jgi:hypothetical protein